MSYSVIVPTYNNEKTLPCLLESLQRQTLQPDEIIVADGRSSDATRQIAAAWGTKIVDNPIRHAAGGRNRGVQAARSPWLAFTDSDCILPPDWLEQADRQIQEDSSLVALGGPMRATPPVNEIERVASEAFLLGVMQFPAEPTSAIHRGLQGAFITANVFYRRDVFLTIGGFDEWFKNYAEDIDLFWRVLDLHSGRMLYHPDIRVFHSFPTTWKALYRKWRQYGLASCYLQRRHLGRFHFDGSHYQRLANALLDSVRGAEQHSVTLARIVQLTGHLHGKVVGSIRLRVVNL